MTDCTIFNYFIVKKYINKDTIHTLDLENENDDDESPMRTLQTMSLTLGKVQMG